MRYNFKDESVQDTGVRFPKVDLKKDEIARVCVVSPYFEVTVRHWVTRMGYLHCHAAADVKDFLELAKIEKDAGRPDLCGMCKMAINPDFKDIVGYPMRHFATYVLRYHTDVRGNLLHDQLAYHLEIWLMGNKKYRELISMQKEWGSLQTHDLELTCIEAKYQNFDISLKKASHWVVQKDQVVEYLKIETEKYPLFECLGEVVDKETLNRRFESARRRAFPDEEANLDSSVVPDVKTAQGQPAPTVEDDSPFASLGEPVPPVVTEDEKKKADTPEAKGTLEDLIP